MEKVKITKTEYVAIPRENIVQWLVDEDLLEHLGDGQYRIAPRVTDGKFDIKIHLRKWAYFALFDELDHTS